VHDLDRAMFESERSDGETAEAEQQEFLEILGELVHSEGGQAPDWGRAEFETGCGTGIPGGRAAREIALASELLEVQTEAELDRFLGGVLRRAAGAAGDIAGSGASRALRGVLKNAAGRALPTIGRAVGARIGPGFGGIGERVGASAGSLLGLELEGLSGEDREFEVARAFVRFADAAANEAAAAPSNLAPADVANAAVTNAAQQHMPGLLASRSDDITRPPASGGRWARQGKTIIIYGAPRPERGEPR
jgi:hypothetical protein